MKVRKFNENLSLIEPEVGDYVICHDDNTRDNRVNLFLEKNAGILIKIVYANVYSYFVKYDNIPNAIRTSFNYVFLDGNLSSNVRNFSRVEVKYFSKNEEDLEIYKNAEKYNL